MRLDKLLANSGFGSRKEVRTIIKNKRITVNNETITDNGYHVDPEQDHIMIDDKPVTYRKFIYMMMNKKQGYLSATRDSKDQTVIDLLPEHLRHFNPFPVGRLDKNTEGLLLLTNDGELAHQLTSPSKNIAKTYFAKVKGRVTQEDCQQFEKGVTLDDGYITKPGVLHIKKSDEISEIELTITEGKFHQVKRMFQSVGKKVIYLKRIQMGNIYLDPNLSLGQFRELNEEELSYCYSLKKG